MENGGKNMISEKLKELREDTSMNKKQFAEFLGIKYTTYNGYETGAREPASDFLILVSRKMDVSIDYLLGIQESPNILRSYQMDSSEYSLIKKYRKLDNRGKNIVNLILDQEYEESLMQEKEQSPETSDIIYRPIYELRVSAGTGQFLDSNDYEIRAFPAADVPPDSTFGVIISGDSMEPKYYDGEIAFAKQDPDFAVGDIGIFVLDNDGYIKQLAETESGRVLRSFNSQYPDIPITEFSDLRVVGKVVGKL